MLCYYSIVGDVIDGPLVSLESWCGTLAVGICTVHMPVPDCCPHTAGLGSYLYFSSH